MPIVVGDKYVVFGNDCYVNVKSVVDHECKIGDGVHIMGSSYIAGRVEIDDFASIGANATILPDIKIGKNAIIGAGSVVTKNVKPNEIVIGNPAKFYKNKNKQIKRLKKFINNWDNNTNLVLVTHYVVILEILGIGAGSGEIIISNKRYEIKDRIEIN